MFATLHIIGKFLHSKWATTGHGEAIADRPADRSGSNSSHSSHSTHPAAETGGSSLYVVMARSVQRVPRPLACTATTCATRNRLVPAPRAHTSSPFRSSSILRGRYQPETLFETTTLDAVTSCAFLLEVRYRPRPTSPQLCPRLCPRLCFFSFLGRCPLPPSHLTAPYVLVAASCSAWHSPPHTRLSVCRTVQRCMAKLATCPRPSTHSVMQPTSLSRSGESLLL